MKITIGSFFAKQARQEVIKENGCMVRPIKNEDAVKIYLGYNWLSIENFLRCRDYQGGGE